MTNPKDKIGATKYGQFHLVPIGPLYEVSAAMAEGAEKYGPYNWRDEPVSMSVYYSAALRHLTAWFDGEDIDPDSGIHHVSKAIAGLMIIRDAIIEECAVDDRPRAETDPVALDAMRADLRRALRGNTPDHVILDESANVEPHRTEAAARQMAVAEERARTFASEEANK